MSKDYYKVLGVEKSATADEIKKAFRKKAHEYHPDKGTGNEDKFKEVSEAYHVLNNPQKRKEYDQFGSTFGGASGASNGVNWSDFVRQGGGGYSSHINIDDLGDIFGDFFGGRTTSRRRAKGQDMEAQLTISLEEAVFGASKTVDIAKDVVCDKCHGNGAEPGSKISTCKTCNGSGQVKSTQQTFFGAFSSVTTCPECDGEGKQVEKACSQCRGRGSIKGSERIKINIPAGINSGETLRLSGKGGAGHKGNPAGDLYIRISVLPHKVFKRQGDDLYTNKTITISQALLGDKIKVKTLDGEVNLKIPAGTASGKQFVLKGKGVGRLRSHGRGDMVVEVKVEIPKKLSRTQKKLVEKLKEEGI